MADRRRRTDRLFRLIWPPATHRGLKAAAVDRLEELRDTRAQLSDDEYTRRRTAALAGLAENRYVEGALAVAFGAVAAAFGGGAVYLLWAGFAPWAAALAVAAVPAGVVGVRMYRFWSTKRRLSIGDRLVVVAELVRQRLVTAAEAAGLRDGIDRLGRARPALHRGPADGLGPGWVPAYGSLPEFPALPPPPPLRRGLYVHFWCGRDEFEVVASAAEVRTVACPWPDGPWAGRKLVWLHCRGVRTSTPPAAGTGPATVTFFLIPAHYVTEARATDPPPPPPEQPNDFQGIFPPDQPPPIIAVPLDELERIVADLRAPTPT